MSIELEFTFRNKRYGDAEKGLRAFASALNKDWDGAAKVLSRELKEFLEQVAKAMASRHSGGWPGGTGTQTLSRRSGKLTDSIMKSVEVRGQTFATLQGFIGAMVPYANIQEMGGTITPKKSKFLAIPLAAALNSKGVPLKPGPRSWANTFVAKSKAGNLIIFQKRGASIVPLYVLKTSVTIPPRLGFRKTLEVGIPYFVDRVMDQLVKDIIGKA